MFSLLFDVALSISDICYHQRIENINVGEIIRCSFAFLYGSLNGAAIYIGSISSLELSLINTCFKSCVSQDFGGSIFFESKQLLIKACSWENCYVNNSQDNIYGNAIYSSTKNTEMNMTASLACGPYRSISGDSTHHFSSETLSVSCINNTLCCSQGGSSGFQVDGKDRNAIYYSKYLNIINSNSRHIMSIWPDPVTLEIYHSNFINNSIWDTHFILYDGVMKIKHCYLCITSTSLLFQNNAVFYNCSGNVQYTGITQNEFGIIRQSNIVAEFCGINSPKFCFETKKPRVTMLSVLSLPFQLIKGINYH